MIVGCAWRIGRVDAFRPKGYGFDSRSSRHVVTLGKSFTHSCLWRFGVKLRHSIHAVSGLIHPPSGSDSDRLSGPEDEDALRLSRPPVLDDRTVSLVMFN